MRIGEFKEIKGCSDGSEPLLQFSRAPNPSPTMLELETGWFPVAPSGSTSAGHPQFGHMTLLPLPVEGSSPVDRELVLNAQTTGGFQPCLPELQTDYSVKF